MASYRKESSSVLSSMTLTKHSLNAAVMQRHDTAADQWWRRRWRPTTDASPCSHCPAGRTIQQARLGVHHDVREQKECPLIHPAETAALWNLDHSSNTYHASIAKKGFTEYCYIIAQILKSPRSRSHLLLQQHFPQQTVNFDASWVSSFLTAHQHTIGHFSAMISMHHDLEHQIWLSKMNQHAKYLGERLLVQK